MERAILPYIEWEVLCEPITISKVDDIKELPEGEKRVLITRDEKYKLQAKLSTKDPSLFKSFSEKKDIPGSFLDEYFDITGSDQQDLKYYTLESCYIDGVTLRIIEEEPLCEANLHIKGVKIKQKTEAEGVWFTEWYINGPQNDVFRKSTRRKISKTFFRERLGNKGEKIHSMEVSGGIIGSSSLDFLRIKACENRFLITQVPKGIGPEWSSNIGIEYRKDWGLIPDVNEREKISEFCSFIFGRQFLSVGYTIFDKDGNVVEESACNPWGNNIRSLCSKKDVAPIRISESTSRGKAEDLISQLLPSYYEMREPLCLKEALWHYWTSRNMSIGANLPILAAALESIMNGWYKYTKSKSRGVYMKKKEFESLLKEEIEGIKRKFENKPDGDKIIVNILKAYNFGITERYRVFFKEINLSIDNHEWEAIEERHKFVHGRIIFDETDWKQVIQHVNTFETLLHKILLKLLGYSGTFIDRSITGWRDKQLV